MPWLNLLPDYCFNLSVIFAPVLDKGLDGDFEVVCHFTAADCSIGIQMCGAWIGTGLPERADIIDYTGQGCGKIRSRDIGCRLDLLTEDIQGVRCGWVTQDERTESWLQGHFAVRERGEGRR